MLFVYIVEQPIKETIKSLFGTKYVIDGEIKAPNGEVVQLRTVWITEKGQNRPRFITIYPV